MNEALLRLGLRAGNGRCHQYWEKVGRPGLYTNACPYCTMCRRKMRWPTAAGLITNHRPIWYPSRVQAGPRTRDNLMMWPNPQKVQPIPYQGLGDGTGSEALHTSAGSHHLIARDAVESIAS